MTRTLQRREFMRAAAASGAVLAVPAFLAGCAVPQAASVAEPAPGNPFMRWFGVDEARLAELMAALTANGADIADIYFQHARTSSLTFERGEVTDAGAEVLQGAGFRVVSGGQTGYASTEDLTTQSMLAAARAAAAVAKGSPAGLPPAFAVAKAGDLYTTVVPWSEVGVDRKLPVLEYIDAKARSMDPAIENVTVRWADGDERVMIATQGGRLVTDRRPMTSMTVLVTARQGSEVQTGFATIAARDELGWYTDDRLDAAVAEAVSRTMILFEARRPPTGEMPVILAAGAGGVLLHEAIGHGLEADFNGQGGVYTDRIGEQVAGPLVTIVDEARLPGERGSLNYDDEGESTGRTVLVRDGVLESYLHDKASAMRFGTSSTGSGRRQSYKFAPMPRMSCTFMEDGPHTREEIVEAVDAGILCESFTDGRVQLGGGDFTFRVKNGWLVERGRITAPLKNISISGNGPQMLERVAMAANDMRLDAGGWTCGKNGQTVPVSQGIPTLLISHLSVSRDDSEAGDDPVATRTAAALRPSGRHRRG